MILLCVDEDEQGWLTQGLRLLMDSAEQGPACRHLARLQELLEYLQEELTEGGNGDELA